MSDMKRFRVNFADYGPLPSGEYVRYDDAQRAVAEAEQRGRDGVAAIATEALRKWYGQGQRDERARIRAAVRAMRPWEWPDHTSISYDEVLAVIDAGGES